MSPHESLYDFLAEAPIACHEIGVSGIVVFVNDTECALLGLAKEEMLGRAIWEFVAPEERTLSREAVRRKLAGAQALETFERDYIRPDGVRLVLEIHERHIRDANAEIVGMRSFLVDITHRKRTEQALQESEKRYRHLVEHASDIIYRTDLHGRFTIFNSVATALLGYSAEELAGRKYVDLVRPDCRAQVRRFYRTQLTKGQSHTYLEFPAIAKDGREVWFGQNVEIVEDEGRVVGFQAITRDITMQRRAEALQQSAREELERRVEERTAELREANERLRCEIGERQREEMARRELERQMQHTQRLESLGVLAGGIAHDFNNLLAVVMGRAGLALDELPAESAARSNVAEVISAAKTAAELTQQMLAYSGRGKFVVEPLDLSQLIEDATRLVSAVISKKARLILNLAPDLPPVDADPAQIRQVVMNLLTNASEALGEQAGEIRVTTRLRAEGEGGEVLLEVADTGCGMAKETLDRIFDPFFTTKFTGRGLGLAAVQGIIRGHGGTLLVESEPGRGSTFRIVLPASRRRAAKDRRAPAEERSSDAEGKSGANWRPEGLVLVVDDEPAVLSMACEILERSEIRVMAAVNGHDAVRQFEKHADEIAAVLLDLTMPGLDGGEVFRRLHAARPAVKVILCSGYDEHEVSQRIGALETAGFLRKPYGPAELLRTLEAALAKKSLASP